MTPWASAGMTPRGTLTPLSPTTTVVLVVSPGLAEPSEPGAVAVVLGGGVTRVMPARGGGLVVPVVDGAVVDDSVSVVEVDPGAVVVVEAGAVVAVVVVLLGSPGSAVTAGANVPTNRQPMEAATSARKGRRRGMIRED